MKNKKDWHDIQAGLKSQQYFSNNYITPPLYVQLIQSE